MKTHIPYYKLPFRIKLWWAKIFIQMFRGFSETIARIYSSWECEDADAELICDAGNTAQKCGLLPSELLQQRDELREALKLLMAGVNRLPPLTGIHGALENQYKIAEAAIKNTETK